MYETILVHHDDYIFHYPLLTERFFKIYSVSNVSFWSINN